MIHAYSSDVWCPCCRRPKERNAASEPPASQLPETAGLQINPEHSTNHQDAGGCGHQPSCIDLARVTLLMFREKNMVFLQTQTRTQRVCGIAHTCAWHPCLCWPATGLSGRLRRGTELRTALGLCSRGVCVDVCRYVCIYVLHGLILKQKNVLIYVPADHRPFQCVTGASHLLQSPS